MQKAIETTGRDFFDALTTLFSLMLSMRCWVSKILQSWHTLDLVESIDIVVQSDLSSQLDAKIQILV